LAAADKETEVLEEFLERFTIGTFPKECTTQERGRYDYCAHVLGNDIPYSSSIVKLAPTSKTEIHSPAIYSKSEIPVLGHTPLHTSERKKTTSSRVDYIRISSHSSKKIHGNLNPRPHRRPETTSPFIPFTIPHTSTTLTNTKTYQKCHSTQTNELNPRNCEFTFQLNKAKQSIVFSQKPSPSTSNDGLTHNQIKK